ncbi:MAG TPA: alkaline phosphatase family protein [Terracidiphilus sp.]|nr:alkaline phosphatase family protein [Terracidiphilus sp.]
MIPNPPRSICFKSCAALVAAQLVFAGIPMPASAQASSSTADPPTASPIRHVIVIIGENRSFDHVFATYKPRNGQSVRNLLSEHIVNANGTPGPDYGKALQLKSVDDSDDGYQLSPNDSRTAYKTLPPLLAGGPTKPFFSTLAEAKAAESGLPNDQYYTYLTTGGTGLTSGTPDTRLKNVNNLPPGPYQITPGIPYDAYAASPVHRYYQMWQELDCSGARATNANPSGCKADLFPWVEATIGAGSNGKPEPAGFAGEGSSSMGFYNMQQGDAPYLKFLADHYSMSDNYHQAGSGGTGLNHLLLGMGDAVWFSDSKGNAAEPPHNQLVAAGTANAGVVDEVENPNPAPGTNNWYTEDGYGGGGGGSAFFGGGSYSDCASANAPGATAVVDYFNSLPFHVDSKCEAGHYYLLNNYNPGYFGNGKNAYTDANPANTVFTVPPTTVRSLGDELIQKNITFKYYGDQWHRYQNDPYYQNPLDAYCNICNFLQYETSIMTDPAHVAAHLQDTTDLYADIQKGDLPAVSWVKPSGLVDGHPASSKLDLFEGFVMKIVDMVQAQPKLWQSTAIFVTFDEGGGYYDSGYVQPLDFFGDGTRVPLIVVSPYTHAGHISHSYSDHVSILKFIEKNWALKPVTDRSRDNLPDPKTTTDNPYIPLNGPAIGDLWDMFNFPR